MRLAGPRTGSVLHRSGQVVGLDLRCLVAAMLLLLLTDRTFGQLPKLVKEITEGQKTGEAAESEKPPPPSLAELIAENDRQLAEAEKQLEAARQATPEGSEPPESLVRRVELRKRIAGVLAQRRARQEQNSLLQTQLDESVRRSAEPDRAPPYSYVQVDRLRDELALESTAAGNSAAMVRSAEQALQQARDDFKKAEQQRRQAKEALGNNKDAVRQDELAAVAQLAELQSELAAQTVELRTIDRNNLQLEAELDEQQVAHLKRQIEVMEPHVEFSQGHLDEVLQELSKREEVLANELENTRAAVAAKRRAQDELKQGDNGQADPAAVAARGEKLQQEVLTLQEQVAALNRRQQLLAELSQLWKRRFDVVNHRPDAAQLLQWEEETAADIEQLDAERQRVTDQMVQLRSDLTALETRLGETEDTAVAEQLRGQRDALLERSMVYSAQLAALDHSRRLHQKLLAEIRGDEDAAGLRDFLSTAWQWVRHVWHYELTSVDDRPITVAKIVSGLVLMIIGLLISRWLSRWFGRRLLPRMHVNESAAAALQSVAFYVLVVIFAFIALTMVNVPLTAFAILGGAVAIGVGFGSQQIANNFISGLILLAERPIRVGDLVQMQDLFGTIERIGARSTRLKTPQNLEVIIPNSAFLENNVTNWTLTDSNIRTSVNVGVAYGSPTREVARLMLKAADEHGLIMENPAPFVWFRDFGDNALAFELHFWLRVRTLSDRVRIESDLRFIIDQMFREAGITIAFPQRDVHLDTLRPLEVRVVDSSSTADSKITPES